jgi:competence protein ComFC
VNAGFRSFIVWFNTGLAFLYPEVCQLCRKSRATPAEGFVCAGCRKQVRFIERPYCERCGYPYEGAITQTFECANCRTLDFSFRYARSAVVAQDAVLDVIHRYKYNRALWFETFLVDLFVVRSKPELRSTDWDWIVPVPLHPTKERQREFNQAERMGAGLSRATSIPLNARLLQRVLPTRTQTRLSREERLANVSNAFTIRGGGTEAAGSRIVLVDDVFTTGATTNACARVLRNAGANDVCVWTVARGI